MDTTPPPPLILCIAINTTSAGTFNVTRNFYAEYAAGRSAQDSARILLVVPDLPAFGEFVSAGRVEVRRFRLGGGIAGALRRIWFELVWVRRAVRAHRPTGVLVLGNYSLVRLPVGKAVLMRHPYLVDPSAVRRLGFGWRRLQEQLRRMAFQRTLATGPRIVVQSEAMRDALVAAFGIEPARVHAVPNPVPGFVLDARGEAPRGRGARERALFYPSRYNEHKNHELIVELATRHRARLRELGLRFLVTLRDDARTAPLLRRIAEQGLGELIVNLGELPQESLAQYYRSSIGLFFPSHAETYPNALPEALCFGLPIVANDRPYARVICGDAAVYFQAERADAALAAIERMLEDWADWSARAQAASRQLPSARDWAERMIGICVKGA